VQKAQGGFAILDKAAGLRAFTLPAEAGKHEFSSSPAIVVKKVVVSKLGK
jgi:hypothetical protein